MMQSPIGIAAATAAAVVVGGYAVANAAFLHRGANGYGSCTTAEEVAKGIDLAGKTAVVTGASNGIGKETAYVLALHGCRVYLPCRTLAKSKETIDEIIRKCAQSSVTIEPGQLIAAECDLADLASVQKFARFVRASGEPIDILINNAGIMAIQTRVETAQKLESQIGTNHVAHYLLTSQLLPQLQRAPKGARIVCVSSSAHRAGERDAMLNDKLESNSYGPWRAYGNSKLANIIHAKELNERYGNSGIQAFSVHPGGILTGLGRSLPFYYAPMLLATPFFFKSVPQGAATSIYCAIHPTAKLSAGRFHQDCNVSPTKKEDIVNDAALRKTFWETSERLIKDFKD